MNQCNHSNIEEFTTGDFRCADCASHFANKAELDEALAKVKPKKRISPLAVAILLSLSSCATHQPTPMKARTLTPEQRVSLCQRIAKNDHDYAHCIGVKWESLEEKGSSKQ